MLTLFGLTMVAFVGSSSTPSQPRCNDDTVLQQVVSQYIGLSEYAGMTDAKIRDEIIAAPQMQHWRDLARESVVGEAIASWVFDIDIQATIAAQHLVKSITAISSSYEQDSSTYRCQVTLDFENDNLIPYLTLAALNAWLQLDNGNDNLNAAASANEMAKWRPAEHVLSSRLRHAAETMASCVRKRVTFTIYPGKSAFTIGLDTRSAFEQDCLMRSFTGTGYRVGRF